MNGMKRNVYKNVSVGRTILAEKSPKNDKSAFIPALFSDAMVGRLLPESAVAECEVLLPDRVTAPFRTASRWLAGIIAKLREATSFNVPVGYEDENGFHYGIPPVPQVRRMCRVAVVSVAFIGIVASTPFSAFAVQSVTLAWNPSTSPNVVGYNVYYGPACGTYTNMISVGNVTSTTIPGLVEGGCDYFVVKAFDASGLESLPSNEVPYNIPDHAILAINTAQMNKSITITATGAIPQAWALESSTNLKTWTVIAEGTNSQISIPVVATGIPVQFFRLISE